MQIVLGSILHLHVAGMAVFDRLPDVATTLTLCPCKPNGVPSVGHRSNYVFFHTHLVKMKVISIKKVCYGATDFCHLKETIMGESG